MKSIITLIILMLSINAFGAIQVRLETDSNSISMNEIIEMKIKVLGTRNSPRPDFPSTEHYQIQYSGSSSQINIINGKTTISATYHYRFYPLKAGSFKVGPASVTINGQKYQSNTFNMTVAKAKSMPKKDRNYYIETSLDKKEAFLGEQVIYTFKLYNKVRIYNSSLDIPKFDGFISEALGQEKSVIKIINGERWKVTELRYLLLPQKTGIITIPRTSLDAKLVVRESFFGADTKPIRFLSDELKIKIKELPTVGKPDNFSGLIGVFDITTKIEKNNLKKGESTTFTMTISGKGDTSDLDEPIFDTKDFKVYNDKPVYKKNLEGEVITSSKIFKKAIIPQKEGVLTIPEISINYFDINEKKYKTAKTKSITLNVLPSEKGAEELNLISSSNNYVAKKKIKLLGKDLMPISYNSKILNGKLFDRKAKYFLYFLNFLFPLIYLFFLVIKQISNKRKSDTGRKRRLKAFTQFNKNIGNIKKKKNCPAEVMSAIKNYLGDKLEIDGMAITSVDLPRILSTKNVSPETIMDLKNIFIKIDSTQFGGVKFDIDEQTNLIKSAVSAIKQIDKEIR